MIYFIIGASGSGKTACLEPLKNLLPEFTLYDFDDIGVPDNADKKWRQEATEKWINKLGTDSESKDICLLGQMVPAEILSSPSAANVHAMHMILLDCSDEMRIKRLKKRNSYGINQETLNWAAWLRVHCNDPTWEPHVIKKESSKQMCFEKWDALKSWGNTADITIIDTTNLSLDEVSIQISRYINVQELGVKIKPLSENDVNPLSDAFLKENYNKTKALFEQYLQEQNQSKRSVWVATDKNNNYLGYITVVWTTPYPVFSENNIPELNDFNVIPSRQHYGVGSCLIEHVETIVSEQYDRIGLGVGLFKDYGAAQSLYVKRGYSPNKEGITYTQHPVKPFTSYPIDDDCLLWLTKQLVRK